MPLRIAVIGAGLIGQVHARLVAAESACVLTAIADPTPAAQRLADELGVAWYPDHERLLAHEGLDGAIVAVPNALHGTVGLACASLGVHMLVEKPIAQTVEEGLQLIEASEAAGVQILVGHHRRHDPAVIRAREIIQSGDLGDLILVSVIWAARKPDTYWDVPWRGSKGGGPTLINLIHDIDCLRYLCGEVVEVQAMSSHTARRLAVEDSVVLLARFDTGALATVALSDATSSPWNWEAGTNDNPAVAWSGQNSYRFMGSRGSLEFPNLVAWHHEGEPLGAWGDPLIATPYGLGPRASHEAQLRHFCQVIRGEALPRVDGRDGLATLAATVAVLEASTTGRRAVPAVVSPPRGDTGSAMTP